MKDEVIHQFKQGSHFELDPKRIRVLVWNLYKGKRKNWKNDFLGLAQNADLLILQEAHLTPQMEETFRDHEKFWAFATSFTYRHNKTKTGLMTGSIAVPQHIDYRRSEDREMLVRTPKMSLFTYHPLQQSTETLLVVNIHAINFKGRNSFCRHIRQLDEMISNHQGPIIAAGDFNTWSRFRFEHLHEVMEQHCLEPVVFSPDHRTRFFGKPLDHAFIRGGKILQTQVHHLLTSSDHKALYFEFSLEEAQALLKKPIYEFLDLKDEQNPLDLML